MNLDGEGEPPYISDGFQQRLAPSSVVRFLQTQKFFRSKKVVLTGLIFFVGFPFTILVVRLILWRRRGRFRRRLDPELESTDIRHTDHPHDTQRKVKCQD